MGALKTHGLSWPTEWKGASWVGARCQRCSQGPVEEDQAHEVEQQNRWSRSRRRWTHSRGRSGLRWHQSPSLKHPGWCQSPSPALHDPILLMSSSTDPQKFFIYGSDLMNLGAGHGNVMPPHMLRRNWGSKFILRWIKSWALNQICLQTSPSS